MRLRVTPSTSRTRWLRLKRPRILCWRRHGKAGGCQIYGGVAQLGEHLPCKQGVKSSNLSVSIEYEATSSTQTVYLENFIQRMILRKDFQRNQTSEKQTENRMGNHTVIIKKRYNAIYRRSSKKRAQGGCLGTESRRKT